MKFWRRHWYYIGGVLFIALAFFMGFCGANIFSRIQVILIFSFMAMLIHQVEEYGIPGGFPSINNMVSFKEKKAPDRYPFNANQVWISNVFLTYTFYIAAIIFPHLIWLAISQMVLGFLQFFAHGIFINVRLKSIYNPGLGSTIFLQYPIGIYYIWYVTTNNLASTTDFIIGIPCALIAGVLLFGLPILLLRNRESKYPFAEEEMYGFAKEKIKKMTAN